MTNRYRTEAATIDLMAPKATMGMTAQQIVSYMMDNYKTTLDDSGVPCKPANEATAYLMAVSNAIFDPSDWKAPCYAVFPQCGIEWAKAAIIWYHGAKPQESFVGVYSPGYSC